MAAVESDYLLLAAYCIIFYLGGMGKANFREWIKADFREWTKADSTHASQQTLFIVSGSPSDPIPGEVP